MPNWTVEVVCIVVCLCVGGKTGLWFVYEDKIAKFQTSLLNENIEGNSAKVSL